MRGFFNWSFRYTRNKFYKILFFFILFLVFSFFVSSCKVHATALPSTESLMYSQTQNCTVSSSSPYDISCSKGTSYKFLFNTNRTDNNSTYITPMILNTNEYNVLVSNLVYDIKLDQVYTIDSTYKSFYLNFNFNQSSLVSSSNVGGSNYFTINMFPLDSLDSNNEVDRTLNAPSIYNFHPYFCSYFDYDSQEMKTCNMILDSTSAGFKWILDLPQGTKLNRFVIYFGTNTLYNGSSKLWTPFNNSTLAYRLPDSGSFYYDSNYWRKSNIITYGSGSAYGVTMNQYKTNINNGTYTNIGLWWYPKNILLSAPEFTLPDYSSFVSYDSTSYTANATKKSFTTLYTIEQQTILNNAIVSIEEEFNEQQGVSDTWFEDSLDGFTNSDQSNSFINIFNALITKPFQKLNESVNEDLFSDHASNSEGTGGLNLGLCTGRNIVGGIPEDRIRLPIYHGVAWDFPCLHYDIYSKLNSDTVNFAFYPSTVDGHSIQSGSQYNLYSIIRLILRGFLVFCLYKSCLDIYHYILDSDRKEIEVLDL